MLWYNEFQQEKFDGKADKVLKKKRGITMEDLKSSQLGMIFTGSFLGAGFVSGQEIMQFFGVFGKMGIVGMILSVFLFGIFGYIFL